MSSHFILGTGIAMATGKVILIHLDYKPRYLAIAGLRGLIKGGHVPAFFNKVIIEPCN